MPCIAAHAAACEASTFPWLAASAIAPASGGTLGSFDHVSFLSVCRSGASTGAIAAPPANAAVLLAALPAYFPTILRALGFGAVAI
jgi:hypothetical protein